MGKIKSLLGNRWVGFSLASILYILWFVVWTENLWLLLGLPLIYDIYISKLMHKYIWSRNAELCRRSRAYKSVYEWVNAIVFATVVATLCHTYIFQLYVIPSSSMEKSLLVGDYLYVSKLSYGPKMPNTPVSMPFVHNLMPMSTTKSSFSDIIQWRYKRLAGLKQIERDEVVVFNFPAGDSVLLENPAVTYYDVLRSYQYTFGKEEGRRKLFEDYTVVARPVDKRDNYIKRCVAIAGDTIEIVDSKLYVNSKLEPNHDGRQFKHTVQVTSPLSKSLFERLGITEASGNGSVYDIPLTGEMVKQIKALPNVISVEKNISRGASGYTFPFDDEHYPWSADNYGKLWIPERGATVELTLENLPLYERIIDVYEQNDLKVENGVIYINGEASDSYTFKMNYYWMMGDNRHNSADSRFWGFVPEDHVVGKAQLVWMSLDAAGSFPGNIRWDRVFKRVK